MMDKRRVLPYLTHHCWANVNPSPLLATNVRPSRSRIGRSSYGLSFANRPPLGVMSSPHGYFIHLSIELGYFILDPLRVKRIDETAEEAPPSRILFVERTVDILFLPFPHSRSWCSKGSKSLRWTVFRILGEAKISCDCCFMDPQYSLSEKTISFRQQFSRSCAVSG